jgi:transposase
MAAALGAETERWCIVLVVVERDGSLVLHAEPTRTAVPCPVCGTVSHRQHSWYQRRPLDLPWRGAIVRMNVRTRRWFCDEPTCPRKIFAERFEGALARYARRTVVADALLRTFALQAGGEGGARLARTAGVPVSPDTLLRLLRAIQDQVVTPRVLGVDDVALRRGKRRYGTLLINLETHRPIDLIDERTAEVFAGWLRRHPGVEIIVRDRAGAYAEGGRQGAPNAVQVADRFHLSANASAALDEVLRSRRRRVEYVVVAAEPSVDVAVLSAPAPSPPMSISRAKRYALEVRVRRAARWEAVHERFAAGHPQRQIARELGIARMTGQRLLNTPLPSITAPPESCPSEPSRPGGFSSPSLLPYLEYLQVRWQAGCSNILQLHREIAQLGYMGSRSLMYRALVPWRGPRAPPEAGVGSRRRGGRPRQVKRFSLRWLCLRPPEQLDHDEQDALQLALEGDERLAVGYLLLQRFRRLIARRGLRDLNTWLDDAIASELAPFVSLAHGIQADRAAVDAGLTLPWSTGPVEGHVTRAKLFKRQGYGRAKTELLRRRIVSAA